MTFLQNGRTNKKNRQSNVWHVGQYVRLSKEDGDKPESDSIQNQQRIISKHIEYMEQQGEQIASVKVYSDDGYAGGSLNRPAFQQMMRAVEAGEINCVIFKDLSRLGRNYPELGKLMEDYFPQKGVRVISVLNNLDSLKSPETYCSAIVSFSNIVNDDYIRQLSIKIKSTLDMKRNSGEFIGNYAPYGYVKSLDDKNLWLIDEEAAEVVKKIFRLTVEGMGPYQIAKRLMEEKVEKPSYYQATRQRGNYQTMCDFETPYNWTGGSVVRILERPEYMGDTVNFRSHKESYKDKKAVKNNSDEILVFQDTHEPIIDRRTWYMVQELRKTVRRVDTNGEGSLLTGKLYCADCGGKMHYRRSTTRAARDWRGIPNGGTERTSAGFNCGTYNSSRKQYKQVCFSHSIKEDTVKQLILETIRYALKSVRMDEAAFIKNMRSASEVRDKGEVKKLKADFSKKKKRFADLDLLIKKVYEDNAMGKLPDRRYEMLSSDYEKEQQELEISMQEIREKLAQFEDDTDRTEEFLSLVRKYTDIQELTPAIVNEFVDKVMVHKIEEIDGERVQEIEIFLNYIGKVELPVQELSEEEMAAEEKKRKRRAYSRAYLKEYRKKHRPEIRRVIEGAREADKQKQIAEAEASADGLLHTDGTEQVAAMVAGENKIIVESSLPTKEEVKAKYGR